MSSLAFPAWDTLEPAYIDEFGPIARDVYAAAGNLWPSAHAYASRVLLDADPSRALTLLLKTAAQVTRTRARKFSLIDNLDGYLFQSFTRVVFAELEKDSNRRRFEAQARVDAELNGQADNVERRILLSELIGAMDDWTRCVFEWLTLDYTFEEIGRHLGINPKVVRTRFYRNLQRLKGHLG